MTDSKKQAKEATPNDGNADQAQGAKTPDRAAGQVHVEPDYVPGDNSHDNDFGTGKVIYDDSSKPVGPEVVRPEDQGGTRRRDDVIVDTGPGGEVGASRREGKAHRAGQDN